MFFIKINLKCIKYIFFLQILCSNYVYSVEPDYRASPEIAEKNISQSSVGLSKSHMVVCADKRAAEAANKILKMGGNAIDAAIAAQNVLSVVEPQSSGLGGGGFLIFYNKKRNILEAWDGREFAPNNASPNQYIDNNNKKMLFMKALINPVSIGVPGLYSMLADAHQKNGSMQWSHLFKDAITYAESYSVSPRLNKMLTWASHIKNDEYSRKIYFKNDKPKEVGAIVNNFKLAESLKILSQNGYSINSGKIANLINQELFSLITAEDLSKWKTIKRNPICKKYKKYKICGFPPPTSGGIGVLQILSILEKFDTQFDYKNTSLDEHLFLEASRLAYADREIFIADPDFFKVPTKALLNNEYINQRANKINLKKAVKEFKNGTPKNFINNGLLPGTNLNTSSTTHISIVDSYGNAAALTSSIEFAFGSGKTIGGFFLNNQLTDFSFLSKNQDGIKIANSVEPYKKPRSSMAPTMVFENDQLIGVFGSPGGSRIICYVAKTLYYLISFNTSLEEAVSLPHLCSRSAVSEIEKKDYGLENLSNLKLLGHEIIEKEMNSGLNVIWKYDDNWIGVSDHRREGVALGF
ncbi:gamma-glutamyltransferase [Alphaproteobacteria bacterium]|nr:gamma-glutamyltransferase [Alphaproteobacteria bacterium]